MICPKCHQLVEYLFFDTHCHRCREDQRAAGILPADPELQAQRDELSSSFRLSCDRWSTALLFAVLLLWSSLERAARRLWRACRVVAKRLYAWLNWRRECAWCNRWLGGNPIAYAVTHGICRKCLETQTGQLTTKNAKNAETGMPSLSSLRSLR